MENTLELHEEDIKIAASNLKTIFFSDNKLMRDLTLEVRNMKRISKTFHMCHTTKATIQAVEHRLFEIDKSLLNVCLISDELSQLQQICHHGYEDMPDPEKLYPDSYGTFIELMSQYETNCKQKEVLENLINQVHMKLLKAQTGSGTRPSKTTLQHSKSLESQCTENTESKSCSGNRRQSVDSAVHFSISLFPELSEETLKIAQQEYNKRRPLQSYTQHVATQKQPSTAGPIRNSRSPKKIQENTSVYSPVKQCPSCYTSRGSLRGSLNRVRSPVLTSFLQKEREKDCLVDITNLSLDKS